MCSQQSEPLLFGGDLNSVLLYDDRLHGNPITQLEVQDFENCLNHNNLACVKTVGDYYTWCNNQDNADIIYSRIYRFIADINWLSSYHGDVIEVLERGVSDHCPVMIDLVVGESPRRPPFGFLNVLADHEDFSNILVDRW